jgi:glycosyltransferase involved in cell wall biosynthesis
MITQSTYPADPRVRRQAEVLDAAGYEVDIICTYLPNQIPIEKFGNITAHRSMMDKREESMAIYILKSFKFFFKAFIKLQKLHKQRNYSLIQVHNMPDYHIFIGLLQKFAGVPLVLDIHDIVPELFASKWSGKKSKYLLKVVTLVEKLSTKFAAHVITVTDKCKELLINRGVPDEKVTLVLNTPNRDIFKFDSTRNFNYINEDLRMLYHGTVAHRFGLHTAISAMPQILEKIPNSKFFIYGKYDTSYKQQLEELIKDLNLENNVFLGGRLSMEEVYEAIKNCHIGMVPYLNNEYMNLALSTKAFEYTGAGIPVIATKLEALSRTFTDDDLYYLNADSPAEIAQKAIYIATHPEENRMKALHANKTLESISWEVMAARYLNLMERLMENKKQVKVYPASQKEPKTSHTY